MSTSFFTPGRLRKVVAFVLILSASNAGALVAMECQAVDHSGLPRECTWMEKLGHCAYNAMVGWEQCRGSLPGPFCDFSGALDLFACGTRGLVDLMIPFRQAVRVAPF